MPLTRVFVKQSIHDGPQDVTICRVDLSLPVSAILKQIADKLSPGVVYDRLVLLENTGNRHQILAYVRQGGEIDKDDVLLVQRDMHQTDLEQALTPMEVPSAAAAGASKESPYTKVVTPPGSQLDQLDESTLEEKFIYDESEGEDTVDESDESYTESGAWKPGKKRKAANYKQKTAKNPLLPPGQRKLSFPPRQSQPVAAAAAAPTKPSTAAAAARKPRRRTKRDNHLTLHPVPNEQRQRLKDFKLSMLTFEAFLLENQEMSVNKSKALVRQVKKLMEGKGIKYGAWPQGIVFCENLKLDLTWNFMKLYDEALSYELTYGRDKGNGWLLRHPVSKLGAYQRHVLECMPTMEGYGKMSSEKPPAKEPTVAIASA